MANPLNGRKFYHLFDDNPDILLQFNNLPNDIDKLRFTLKMLSEKNELNKVMDYFKKVPKNNFKSKICLEKGNELFFDEKKRDYVLAIEQYNMSLCFAEHNSENKGIAYANRCAIYFDLKNYHKCLENIKLARQHNYPKELIDTLNRSEIICQELLTENSESPRIYPKLTYEPHKSVPYVSECVEMAEHELFGRYIKANRDLKVGDLVAIEEPFCFYGLNSVKYKRCAYCLKDNEYSLIPCENCTSTMFCNQDCYINALDKFHRLECKIIDGFQGLLVKYLPPIKLVLSLFSNSNDLPNLQKFVDEVDDNKVNVFTVDHNKHSLLDKYQPIHTLAKNQEKRTVSDLFYKSIITSIVYLLLDQNSSMKKIFHTKNYQKLFLELLYRHLLISDLNMISIKTCENGTFSDYGDGIYAFCSLILHSCAPNIARINIGNSLAIYILRPIKSGEPLYCAYDGLHHFQDIRKKRQEDLLKQYFFTCQCEACINNYPHIQEMNLSKISTNLPFDIDNNDNNCIGAESNIQKYCDYLMKYYNYYPCIQIIEVQKALQSLLAMAANK